MIETTKELNKNRSHIAKKLHSQNKLGRKPNVLTPKVLLFIKYYIETSNAIESYRKAFKIKENVNINSRVYELKNRDYVKDEISRQLKDKLDNLGITDNYILANIKDIVELKDTKDDPRVVSNSLKGLEMLGKYTKLWNDNTTTNNLNINVEKLLRTVEDTEEY